MSIRIAVLLSGRHGRGSNMQCIAKACAAGQIDGEVVLVVGNFSDSPALEAAQSLSIPTLTIPSPSRQSSDTEEAEYASELHAALSASQADLICLAGYLRRLPNSIVHNWSGRIMNTHPALLPAFGGQGMYGGRVHQAAINYGVKVSGCTVHFVDEHYDTGPIILQKIVPVLDNDTAETLAARVLEAEHQAYPAAVSLFAQERLSVEGRNVFIAAERKDV